ncbi:sigma-70 family RNA polymerase sigma factor [Catellatospora sp. NPDC049111]|uniref:sigma-70 family RNA polymerase sigma factor n=1 Tax=Catellatospora sp. NPDC049111 TaxID=3155271 RepID=UPI0033D4A2B1
MTTTASTPAAEFEGFYHAHFTGTVLLVYSFTADMQAAQDVAQEAFARAWQRWHQVSGYHDPLAWIRRVSINLTNSRWRRLRTARSYLERQREEHAAEVSPDHVAVVAALRRLPKNQRSALVLHYLADLSVEDVAQHLDAPVGTVKSWLHRGRSALADTLMLETPEVTAPPAQEIRDRGQARRRVQLAAVTAGAAVVVAFVLAVLTVTAPTATPVVPALGTSPSAALPPGCLPGQIPVDLTLPVSESQVLVNVFNGTKTPDLAENVAADLRNRKITVGTVGDETEYRDLVAVLRYGPESVGEAQLLRAYLVVEPVKLEFDPQRTTADVDLVVGGQFKQFGTPTEMRQKIAQLGQPTLPPGTCKR